MASNIDGRQLLTWFTDSMVALCLTQASGTTTTCTQMVTSIASQASADTGLSNQEKGILTAISTAFSKAATQPSSGIHAVL
jgi:hypothetical protein